MIALAMLRSRIRVELDEDTGVFLCGAARLSCGHVYFTRPVLRAIAEVGAVCLRCGEIEP